MENNIYNNFVQLWVHIEAKHKKKLYLLLIFMLLTSILEVISIGAVVPFLAALTAPERIFDHHLAQPLIVFFGITNPQQLLLLLTIFFSFFAIMSGVVRLALLWIQTRVSHAIGADLAKSMYRRTLFQPYETHISRNSSKVISSIAVKSSQIVTNILTPALIVISSAMILIVILLILILINPIVAVSTFVLFGLFYLSIVKVVKNKLLANGEVISVRQNEVIKVLQEGLGGIRDVLLDGTQAIYTKTFHKSDLKLRKAQGDNQIIGSSPRFIIEAIVIVLFAFMSLFLVNKNGGIQFAIPLLGALALGAQRILPLIQQIFHSWSSIIGSQAVLRDTLEMLNQEIYQNKTLYKDSEITFEKEISLNSVQYRYKTGPWILKNLNLNIKKGSCVGFIGTTASGKSTLLDVLMSLLLPKKGTLNVDGKAVTQNNNQLWQSYISHVPQQVFLSDSTIAENIAFGIPLKDIDFDRVKDVAKIAKVYDEINALVDGFSTITGENGIGLSGGQRQRIGIARALYKKSAVIILDEATNALDDNTEREVMEIIHNMSNKITILIIAHRLTTLKKCDVIYELKNGVIVKSGTYSEIVR
jgi:ATP-binding cassette, subfamily B, bacterial PglK